jgi:cellulose synthase/poly-beta-1,6-N-acetylglucosamine synthase-like glycosyltransferase
MSTIVTAMLVFICITIVVDVLLIIVWKLNFKNYHATPLPGLNLPQVSILLAVRNEEENLARCLDSLLAQNYPPDKMTILVGDDASTDNTRAIIESYRQKDSRVQLVDVDHFLGEARAKANALAHLARANAALEAPGELLLITDADMYLQPRWARGMVDIYRQAPEHKKPGVVTGFTIMQNPGLWAQLQSIDWMFAIGMVKVASDLGLPVATMGNNMMISRKAYEATGGYENLPFSITEDFQILHLTVKLGFPFYNAIDPTVLGFTRPTPSWKDLVLQRQRWMYGAVKLPWPFVFILSVQSVFYPLIVALFFLAPVQALVLLPAKVLFQAGFISLVRHRLYPDKRVKKLRFYRFLFPYDLYSGVLTLATIGMYLFWPRVYWKGRRF